jgi:molecular chaperone GrpE
MASPHSIEYEADATETVDMETLRAENASLRDRLLRALAEAENAALVEGVRAILRILMHTPQRFGIRRIEALGQNFDPNLHEAVAQVEDQSKPPRTVKQVVEDGYMIHDRLLRPARVFVSKQPSDASSVPTDRDSDSEQPTTG